jgi:hypothetical protein
MLSKRGVSYKVALYPLDVKYFLEENLKDEITNQLVLGNFLIQKIE